MRGKVKLNIDGSYLQYNGKTGTGGIISNEDGDILMAFAVPVICNSNNMAKTMATSYCVDLCSSLGFIELDSEIVTKMILNRGTTNLKLKRRVDKILERLSQINATIRHCFREAKQVADCLVKCNAPKSS